MADSVGIGNLENPLERDTAPVLPQVNPMDVRHQAALGPPEVDPFMVPEKPPKAPTAPNPDLTPLIHARTSGASWAHGDFVEKMPYLASSILASGFPEPTVASLPKHVSAAVQWVDSQYTLAGISGGLTGAYTKALSLRDPTLRKETLDFLYSVQSLSPGEQELFAAWAQGQASATPGATAAVVGKVLGATGVQVPEPPAPFSASLTGLQQPEPAAGTTITGQGSEHTVSQIAQLESLIPSLRGKILFDAQGITVADIVDSLNAAKDEWRLTFGLKPGETIFDAARRQGWQATLSGIVAGTGETTFAIAGGLEITAAANVAGTLEGSWESRTGGGPGSGVARTITGSILNAAETPSRIASNMLQDLVGGLGTMLNPGFWSQLVTSPVSTATQSNEQLLGSKNITLDKNLNERFITGSITRDERLINVMGGIAMVALLHGASEFAGVEAATRTTPQDLLLAQETARGAALGEESLAAKALHPLRTWIDPALRRTVIERMGKTVDEWRTETENMQGPIEWLYRSTPANRFFDRVQAIRDDVRRGGITDPIGAFYREVGGFGMSEDLVAKLLKTPREEMARVAAEDMTGASPEEIQHVRDNVEAKQAAANDAARRLSDTETRSAEDLRLLGTARDLGDLTDAEHMALLDKAASGAKLTDEEALMLYGPGALDEGSTPSASGPAVGTAVPPETNATPPPEAVYPDPYLYHETQAGSLDDISMQGLRPQFPDTSQTLKAGELDLADEPTSTLYMDYEAITGEKPPAPEGTGVWEGGHAGGRNPLGARTFFAESPDAAHELVQSAGGIGGGNAWLRIRADAVTNRLGLYEGEKYVEKPISPADLEYYGVDGQWHPLDDLTASQTATPLGAPPKPFTTPVTGEDGEWEVSREAEAELNTVAPNDGQSFYHSTSLENLKGIASRGLEPRLADNPVPQVYFAESGGDASILRPRGVQRSADVILRVDRSSVPDALPDSPLGADDVNVWITDQTVSPDKISYLGEDRQWHLLNDLTPGKEGAKIIPAPDDSAFQAAQLDLQVARAEAASLKLRNPEQIFFPGANYNSLTQFLHRTVVGGTPRGFFEGLAQVMAPIKTIERFVNDLLKRDVFDEGKAPWVSKITDKLNGRPFLYNPNHVGFDSVKADVNATVVARYGRKLGMTTVDIDGIIQRLAEAKNPVEVNDALRWFAARREAYAPADMSAFGKRQLARAYPDEFFEGRNTVDTTLPSGHVVTEPVSSGEVVNGTPQHQPFLPSEFLGREKLYLPNLDVIYEATHFLKRWEQSASLSKRIVGQTWGFSKVLLQLAGRTTMLPLWALFKLPALMIKHTVDPIVGNLDIPGMVSGARPPDVMLNAWEALSHPDAATLGSVNEGLVDMPMSYGVKVPTATFFHEGALTTEGAQALLDRMSWYSNDALAQALMRNGFDVERTATMLEGGDTAMGRFYDTQLSKLISDPAELRAALDRQARAIQQAALGSADHMDMMQNRRMATGQFVQREYTQQAEMDIQDIRTRLGELDRLTDGAAIRQLQEQLRERMDAALADPGTTAHSAGLGDEGFLVKDLQDRFARNELTLPKEIQVTRLGRSMYRDASGKLQLDHGSALEIARDVNAKLSRLTYRVFQPVGWADRTVGRTNFFVQRAYGYYSMYREAGMSVADAEAAATMRASIDAKDFFYDLSSRSTAERSVKNLFWFAPAGGELMYRWFYRIPAEQGNAFVGNLLNFAKVENYINLAKALGVVHKNPDGELVIPIPGAGKFLSAVSGGKMKFVDGETISVPLGSLDPLVTTPMPTMGPLPGKGLSELGKHVPAFRGLANVLAPFGSLGGLLPYTMRKVAASFGIKVPDLMNNDAVDEQWKRQQITGIQLALLDARKNDPQPTLAQFNLDPGASGYLDPTDPGHDAAKTAYEKAMRAWVDRVFSDGTHIAMGIAGAGVLFGDLLPGRALVSTPAQEDWAAFLQKTSGLTGAQWAYARDVWLGSHPQDFPLSVSKGLYTGAEVPKGANPLEYYALGLKQYMDPQQYLDFAAAMQSKWLYEQRSYAETRGISSSGPELLRNWSAHTVSLANRDLAWNQYLLANPDAAAIIAEHDARVSEAFPTYAVRSDESVYLKDTMQGLQAVSSIFTGEGGVPVDEYSRVVSGLKAERARIYQEYKDTGVKPDPVTAGVGRYFDTVISPYMAETKPIWDEISLRAAQGLPTTDLYQQLSAIDLRYATPAGGYPSPAEFFYSAKTPAMQLVARTHWAGEPVSFLTPFARQLVGYQDFAGQDEMWAAIAKNDAIVSAALAATPSGSTQYDALKSWGVAAGQQIASQYGQVGVTQYELSKAAPYVRLRALGTFQNDTTMQQAFQFADTVSAGIAASGGQASGSSSPTQVALKTWFYSWIKSQTDPVFLRDLDVLSLGLSNAPGGRHPLGADLYEAIFFNQFQPAYIGYSVRVAAA